MVADIQLLQGKVIDEPERRTKNISTLIHELALEILSDEDVAVAGTPAHAMTGENA
jgi:hypothetical protein